MIRHIRIIRIISTICILVSLFTLVLPLTSFAFGPYWGPLLSCNQNRDVSGPGGTWNGGYTDPCNTCHLFKTSQNFINFGITLALFVFAPILFLWGGIAIIIAGARGGEEGMKKGREIITKTAFGAAITLGSYLILATFFWAVGAKISPAGQGGIAWPNIDCGAIPKVFK